MRFDSRVVPFMQCEKNRRVQWDEPDRGRSWNCEIRTRALSGQVGVELPDQLLDALLTDGELALEQLEQRILDPQRPIREVVIATPPFARST